jgi:hypothetical protein
MCITRAFQMHVVLAFQNQSFWYIVSQVLFKSIPAFSFVASAASQVLFNLGTSYIYILYYIYISHCHVCVGKWVVPYVAALPGYVMCDSRYPPDHAIFSNETFLEHVLKRSVSQHSKPWLAGKSPN